MLLMIEFFWQDTNNNPPPHQTHSLLLPIWSCFHHAKFSDITKGKFDIVLNLYLQLEFIGTYIHQQSKFIMENFSRFICTVVPLSKNKNQSIMTEKRYQRRILLLWYCVVYAEDRRNNNWWHKWTRTALFYLMAEWIIFFLSSYIAIIPVDIQLQSLTCKFLSIICLQAEAQTVTTY